MPSITRVDPRRALVPLLLAVAGCATWGRPLDHPRSRRSRRGGPGSRSSPRRPRRLPEREHDRSQGPADRRARRGDQPGPELGVPGLILGGRAVGPEHDVQAEPMIGYRRTFGAERNVSGLGIVHAARGKATDGGASYTATRVGAGSRPTCACSARAGGSSHTCSPRCRSPASLPTAPTASTRPGDTASTARAAGHRAAGHRRCLRRLPGRDRGPRAPRNRASRQLFHRARAAMMMRPARCRAWCRGWRRRPARSSRSGSCCRSPWARRSEHATAPRGRANRGVPTARAAGDIVRA